MTASVYIATSLDGFIAREDGGLDWLAPAQSASAGADEAEDYGYTEFMKTVDAIVMGRHTYEKVLTFDPWPYVKPVIVLTTRPLQQPSTGEAEVAADSGDPLAVLDALAARGMRHVYVDGGVTIQRFLQADAIDRLIISRLPILIGRGIPLFGSLGHDIRLKHVSTRSYPSGLVQTEYVRHR